MVKLNKIQKPKFTDPMDESTDIFNEIINNDAVNKIIENTSISGIANEKVRFDSCIFRKVNFDNCDFHRADLTDVVFENCDLSNISFTHGSMYRVEFINCKLTGAKFNDSFMKDVLFKGVLGRYSNFSFAKLKGVNIIESNFESSVFQEVKNEKLSFEDTDLSSVVFYKTPLTGMDFTTCNIDNIEVEANDVSGAAFSVEQALDLTRLLKIVIK